MLPSPTTALTPASPPVGLLSDSSFAQLVNDALRNYQSTLALSRSPLASSPLVTPTLVKDEASPTADERGHGLRLVLQWAVNQLAPSTPLYGLGTQRPFDDPTWRAPGWWRYNILRHRYLVPLHPDEFVDGGRHTETLLALTGISSSDAFFDERNRAIREVAARLRQQLIDGQANAELRRMALEEALLPLEKAPAAVALLGIAATFDDIFPRDLLLAIADQEQLRTPAPTLNELIAQRFLLTGDEGASLWLSPVLRAYVYERQSPPDRQRRHRWIAAHYEAQGAALPAAKQWLRAGQDARAVRTLLPVVHELVNELRVKEVIDLLQQVEAKRLDEGQWYEVQLLLSDLLQRGGQHEEALAACREALLASDEPVNQARVYRRMGKLYESRNQLHALRYYQQAVERFPATDPELAVLLKDRGWLFFLRREWEKAERDLQQALYTLSSQMQVLQADIYDAMASLNREMGHHPRALMYGERALALREESGDLLRIAKSQANLGLLYRAMGEYQHAIAAHHESMGAYQKLENQEGIAISWLNIGAAHFLAQQNQEAINAYNQSLAICQAVGLPLIELKARYNLAEALVVAGEHQAAAAHWRAGFQLCRQHNFDDHEADFLELGSTIRAPLAVDLPAPSEDSGAVPPAFAAQLDEEEEWALALARREQYLTAKRLMQAAHISRATATRRLTRLVEKGWLTAHGKGRGAYYCLADTLSNTEAQPPIQSAEPAVEMVQMRLNAAQPDLAQQYAVTALTLAPLDPAPCYARVNVRFDQAPNLEQYLDLKRRLSELLQLEVDLVIEQDGVRCTDR